MKLIPVVEVEPKTLVAFDFKNKDPHFFSEYYASLEALILYPAAILPVLTFHVDSYNSFELLRTEGDHHTLTSLCGGFTLFKDSEVILTPECCVDLSDLYNWSLACRKTEDYRFGLWIGHPALQVECDGQTMSLYYDKEFEWPSDSDFDNPFIELSTEFVRAELKKAESLQAGLALGLEPILAQAVGFPCPLGARALAGFLPG